MNNSLIEMVLEKSGISSSVSIIIISIAVMLFFGFLGTRITKRLKLPNVTAYIIIGILLVPIWSVLPVNFNGIIPSRVIEGMDFLTDIALAFIAFQASEFFRFKNLKDGGPSVIIITLFESLLASILVFMLCFLVFRINLEFSLVLAALASATAPASTIMTIRQTRAKGEYVNTLLEVVALDDVISLILYTIAISVCSSVESGKEALSFSLIGLPIIKNIACLIIGGLMGFILKLLISKKRTTDNRLIIVIAAIFTFCGICTLLDQSPLLGCMAMGMIYINLTDDDKLFKQLAYFSPPIMLLFFVRSGMKFNLLAFANMNKIGYAPLLVIAIGYFFIRIIGKYGGAYLGSTITKKDKKIRNYLGLGLVPQAGVAIGLAYMGARILGAQDGDNLQTIILASSVLYELVGPGLSKLGLYLSKSYSKDIDELVDESELKVETKGKLPVEILALKINQIREQYQNEKVNPEEDAFNEAVEDYYSSFEEERRPGLGNFINRRRH